MSSRDFVIRPLESISDLMACRKIVRRVWESGDVDGVPLDMFIYLIVAMARNGGIALGAFASDELIGFVFGFLGTGARFGPEAPAAVKLKHHSHMLAVLPEWRNEGVGYALKVAQREAARAQGL